MSDEIRLPAANANELPRPPKGIDDHWCEHPGCTAWGSFGYQKPHRTVWLCGEHRPDGPVEDD